MAKTTIAGILVVMLLVCGWTAEAAICKDANGNPIPCEQDPGGGGGGNLCWSGSCVRCAVQCSEFGGCWNICDYMTANGGCACFFESGSCSEGGTCTYVP